MLDKEKVRVGISPIGWTNDDMPELGEENTFEQCVSEMALAGFSGTEIGNKYPKDAATLKRALDMRGLRICNRWFSTYFLTRPFAETADLFERELDFLSELEAEVIGVSEQSHSIQRAGQDIFGKKYTMDDREWTLLCDGLNGLGRIAASRGIRLSFHHHMGTVVQTEQEIDRMMQNTDPELVFLLLDTGHLHFAGADPERMLERYVSRVGHIHVKDIRRDVLEQAKARKYSFLDAVRSGIFTVPGDGCVDFAPLFGILKKAGYRGWMVVEAEQNPSVANPFAYALKARRYIAKMTGL